MQPTRVIVHLVIWARIYFGVILIGVGVLVVWLDNRGGHPPTHAIPFGPLAVLFGIVSIIVGIVALIRFKRRLKALNYAGSRNPFWSGKKV
jgi:hypothetical protein